MSVKKLAENLAENLAKQITENIAKKRAPLDEQLDGKTAYFLKIDTFFTRRFLTRFLPRFFPRFVWSSFGPCFGMRVPDGASGGGCRVRWLGQSFGMWVESFWMVHLGADVG